MSKIIWMQYLTSYQEVLEKELRDSIPTHEPTSLYTPISYMLSLGGKRMRPILTLLACDVFNKDFKAAIPAAKAVELFHNFSLIHDDIMDNAPLRRGKTTVHERWDLNTGILSGDAMLILAYQLFESYPPTIFRQLAELFSKTALQVCEGQQYDINFEKKDEVHIELYLKMIEYKTAVLVGAALAMGAIVAEAPEKSKEEIYAFGRYLGIAFQLQDDYLDTFGNPETFGKQIGGDIIENKKTILYLKTLELGSEEQKQELLQLSSINPDNPTDKIVAVTELYRASGAEEATRNEIASYTRKAQDVLKTLDLSEDKKQLLYQFSEDLMRRSV
ncbi:MAG TPA: polyprenyl synthetase family protein [Flavobacteriaceae bacterium]|nr:polyprenyl synthetase family protein [Flavobacteriaceae bacterium]